jgi:hypothetical protein
LSEFFLGKSLRRTGRRLPQFLQSLIEKADARFELNTSIILLALPSQGVAARSIQLHFAL